MAVEPVAGMAAEAAASISMGDSSPPEQDDQGDRRNGSKSMHACGTSQGESYSHPAERWGLAPSVSQR
jgi:hypothetical protein